MRIIALAQQKGGVGKSACSVNLACQAVANGLTAAVIDLDIEQATAAKWGERRNGKDQPRVKKATVITLDGLLQELKADKTDWVFLDLPSRAPVVASAGMAAAELIIIPCRPLDVDIEASIDTVRRCVRAGKPYAYLMNIAQSNDQLKRAKQVQSFLRAHKHKVADRIIVQRIMVPDAMRDGLGVNESKPDSDSDKEFADLFAWLQESVQPSGHERRKKGRNKAVLFRCTEERKAQLHRLSDRLSIGRAPDDAVSYTETINQALDALEEVYRKSKRE